MRFPEKLAEYLFAGGTLSEIPEYVATHFACTALPLQRDRNAQKAPAIGRLPQMAKKPVRFLMSIGGGLG